MRAIIRFLLVAKILLLSACAHRDAYAESRRENSASREGKDSYSGTTQRSSLRDGRDSYASSSTKITWHFWKRWKKKRRDSYSVSRTRKIIKKRNPPQGIKNN